jgi:dihydroorotase
VFDEDGKTEHFGPFMSENFLHLYGVRASSENMTLVRTPKSQPLIIPQKVGNVQVFKGGEELHWQLQ